MPAVAACRVRWCVRRGDFFAFAIGPPDIVLIDQDNSASYCKPMNRAVTDTRLSSNRMLSRPLSLLCSGYLADLSNRTESLPRCLFVTIRLRYPCKQAMETWRYREQ
jgi:hypothetical protein